MFLPLTTTRRDSLAGLDLHRVNLNQLAGIYIDIVVAEVNVTAVGLAVRVNPHGTIAIECEGNGTVIGDSNSGSGSGLYSFGAHDSGEVCLIRDDLAAGFITESADGCGAVRSWIALTL